MDRRSRVVLIGDGSSRRQDPKTNPQVTRGTEPDRNVTKLQLRIQNAWSSAGFDSRQLHEEDVDQSHIRI